MTSQAAGGGSNNVHASAGYRLGAGQEVANLRVDGSARLTLTETRLPTT